MNTLNTQQLWQNLQQQGLVTGDLPPANLSLTPWYIRVMQGIAGWIGALFLFVFVGFALTDILKSAELSITFGLLICAAAFFIFRWGQDSDFASQFGLAVSIAGQGVFIFGLFALFKNDSFVLLPLFSIFVFQALLALFIPNAIHRVFTSWSAVLALSFALNALGIYGVSTGIIALSFVLIWSNESLWAVHGKLWRPIGYGLALALVQNEVLHFFSREIWDISGHPNPSALMLYAPFISTVLVVFTFLWVVKRLLDREKILLNNPVAQVAIAAALLLGILSFVAQGMATALLILLLGFATGNRVLMGLGLIALGGFISHYYYQLNNTLLFKSLVLALSGAVLLSVRFALQKYFPFIDSKESDHA
jgi:hypothetical protein